MLNGDMDESKPYCDEEVAKTLIDKHLLVGVTDKTAITLTNYRAFSPSYLQSLGDLRNFARSLCVTSDTALLGSLTAGLLRIGFSIS